MNGKDSDLAYAPLLPLRPPPPHTVTAPTGAAHLLQPKNPHGHSVSPSPGLALGLTLGGALPVGVGAHRANAMHRPPRGHTERSHCPKPPLCPTHPSFPPRAHGEPPALYCPRRLAFSSMSHGWSHTARSLSSGCFFRSLIMHFGSLYVFSRFHGPVAHFFLALSNIPWSGSATEGSFLTASRFWRL